jgi:hypothetical protein
MIVIVEENRAYTAAQTRPASVSDASKEATQSSMRHFAGSINGNVVSATDDGCGGSSGDPTLDVTCFGGMAGFDLRDGFGFFFETVAGRLLGTFPFFGRAGHCFTGVSKTDGGRSNTEGDVGRGAAAAGSAQWMQYL